MEPVFSAHKPGGGMVAPAFSRNAGLAPPPPPPPQPAPAANGTFSAPAAFAAEAPQTQTQQPAPARGPQPPPPPRAAQPLPPPPPPRAAQPPAPAAAPADPGAMSAFGDVSEPVAAAGGVNSERAAAFGNNVTLWKQGFRQGISGSKTAKGIAGATALPGMSGDYIENPEDAFNRGSAARVGPSAKMKAAGAALGLNFPGAPQAPQYEPAAVQPQQGETPQLHDDDAVRQQQQQQQQQQQAMQQQAQQQAQQQHAHAHAQAQQAHEQAQAAYAIQLA
ncbi:hypothetical protein M885DRAFT_564702, partial [Pelagophyceae sp. CCMP2097]